MERWKLLHEHKGLVETLLEKTKFVYSEEFYKLDELEKQKYQRDKMATEAHLNSLCNLLWCENAPQSSNGLGDIFALSLISSMFNNGGVFGTMPPMPKLDEKDFETVGGENKDE